MHDLQGLLLADMLVESSAEIIGDIVLAVRERAGTAEAVHDRTGLAVDTLGDLLTIDRTLSFFQRIAVFDDRYF